MPVYYYIVYRLISGSELYRGDDGRRAEDVASKRSEDTLTRYSQCVIRRFVYWKNYVSQYEGEHLGTYEAGNFSF